MVENADVLIAGAGTAGLPCAIFAAQRGARVVLVEADREIGGTLRRAAGHVSAGGTRLQAARGIADSPEAHAADIRRITRDTVDPDLVERACALAPGIVDWLDRSGLDWDPACPRILHSLEPYSVARTYWGRNRAVSILDAIRPQFEAERAAGRIALRLDTRLDRLERENGAVVGATLSDGSRVRAAQTVLSTGGYAANPDLFARLSGGLRIITGASPFSDGSGIAAAQGAGARVREARLFRPHVGGVEDPPGSHRAPKVLAPSLMPHRPPWEIYVDRSGRRWHREDEPQRAKIEAALLGVADLTFWIVWDREVQERAPPLFAACEPGRIEAAWNVHPAFHRAETIEALAQLAGIDAAGLAATIARYNEPGPDPLGRVHKPAPLARPPFHAVRNHGTTATTCGGLAVDRELRVLGVDGKPIPGLFAAGEILGRDVLSGDRFVGGMGLTPALAFGRWLSESALVW